MTHIWREYTITNHVEPHVMGQLPRDTCLANVLNGLEAEGWLISQLFIHSLGPDFSLVLVNCYQREALPDLSEPDPAYTALDWKEDRKFIPVSTNMTADYTDGVGGKAIVTRLPLVVWEITADRPTPWVFDRDNQTKPAASLIGFSGITLFR